MNFLSGVLCKTRRWIRWSWMKWRRMLRGSTFRTNVRQLPWRWRGAFSPADTSSWTWSSSFSRSGSKGSMINIFLRDILDFTEDAYLHSMETNSSVLEHLTTSVPLITTHLGHRRSSSASLVSLFSYALVCFFSSSCWNIQLCMRSVECYSLYQVSSKIIYLIMTFLHTVSSLRVGGSSRVFERN